MSDLNPYEESLAIDLAKAQARVSELEAGLIDAEKSLDAWEPDPKPCTNRIRTLLRNEGGSDDQ